MTLEEVSNDALVIAGIVGLGIATVPRFMGLWVCSFCCITLLLRWGWVWP